MDVWAAGIMLKVTGSDMTGDRTVLPFTVFAAAGDGKTEAAAPLNLDELSLYNPRQEYVEYEEPEAGQLEQRVASVRKLVEPYTAWCGGTYGQIKPKVQRVVQVGSETYAYLKNPPKDFYPRAGLIGFTGVLGVFLARGSRIKKLVYPAGLMTASASLYYPERAADIAKSTGDSVYDYAVQSYAAVEKMMKPKNKEDLESETKP